MAGQYVATADYVAVTAGDINGNGVVHFVARGGLVPEGVPEEILRGLAERGLIGTIPAVDEPPAPADPPAEVKAETEKPLEEMTLAELRDYAAKNGINIDGATDKPKTIAKIQAAQA